MGERDDGMAGNDDQLRATVARLEARTDALEAAVRALTDPLAARVAQLGPWFTEYVIDGRPYGGSHSYAGDARVPTFFDWAGTPARILELGSFEGAHTLQLAAREGVEEVIGVEGREANLRRARLALDLLPNPKVSFHQADVAGGGAALDAFLPVDPVFCTGVLYHLPEPWLLLRPLAAGTPRLFLDTHHAAGAGADADSEAGGYEGTWFHEGGADDPLSGLSERSFWPHRRGAGAHVPRLRVRRAPAPPGRGLERRRALHLAVHRARRPRRRRAGKLYGTMTPSPAEVPFLPRKGRRPRST